MGVSLFVVLLILLLTKTETFLSTYGNLLSALFVLLASGIASASLMKSIKANKKLNKEKDLRLKKRNISILKSEIKNLKKEIQTQLDYLIMKTIILMLLMIFTLGYGNNTNTEMVAGENYFSASTIEKELTSQQALAKYEKENKGTTDTMHILFAIFVELPLSILILFGIAYFFKRVVASKAQKTRSS